MRLLLATIIFLPFAILAEPVLLSAKEKTYTPEDGTGSGNQTVITFEWSIPKAPPYVEDREFSLIAIRIPDLEKNGVQYWRAELGLGSNGPKAANNLNPWFNRPGLSREEFVTIIAGSEASLVKKMGDVYFHSVSMNYHTIVEHEQELTPKIKKILVSRKGEVESKHRGIMRDMHSTFAQSTAIKLTRMSLKKAGLDFSTAKMEGDYYTPVDRNVASTWKKAAEIDGFGLEYPPRIGFIARIAKPISKK